MANATEITMTPIRGEATETTGTVMVTDGAITVVVDAVDAVAAATAMAETVGKSNRILFIGWRNKARLIFLRWHQKFGPRSILKKKPIKHSKQN